MFSQVGVPELLIILFIVLLLFGSKRLPGLGRQLGGGLREFKDGIRGKHGDEDDDDEDEVKPARERERPALPAPADAEADAEAEPAAETVSERRG
jgi:sec-independent protein translocase protein TatA